MLLCDTCWEVYKGYIGILEDGQPCPKEHCLGHLQDMDELIIPVVKILNEKGYWTEFSCSGHFHSGEEARPYIMFEEEVKEKEIRSLPAGFTVEKGNNGQVVIRKHIRASTEAEMQRKVLKTAADLLEWAEKLKPIERL
jgi:hypothetical protein